MARLVAVVLAGVPSVKAWSGSVGDSATQHVVEFWDEQKGLLDNRVFCLHQTTDGFLWVGTRSGVRRFDGVNFLPPYDGPVPRQARGKVRAVVQSADGTIWIAHEAGMLEEIQDGRVRRHSLLVDDGRSQFRSLAVLEDGRVLIGGTAFWQFTAGVFRRMSPITGSWLVGNAPDGGGLAFGPRPLRVEGEQVELLKVSGFNGTRVRVSYVDSRGHLWLGTQRGVLRADPDRWEPAANGSGLATETVQGMAEDAAGGLWVATTSGLYRLDPSTSAVECWTPLAANRVLTAITADDAGNIWLGTGDSGLIKIRPARFLTLAPPATPERSPVTAVIEAGTAGAVLALTSSGFFVVNDRGFAPLPVESGFDITQVASLAPARFGGAWLGGPWDAPCRLQPSGRIEAFPAMNLPNQAPRRSFYEDSAGQLWTHDLTPSLACFTADGRQDFALPLDSRGELAAVFCEVRNGDLYVGARGLLRRPAGMRYVHRVAAIGGEVVGLVEDAPGRLWVATRHNGLYCVTPRQTRHVTTNDGLPSDALMCLVADLAGALWFGAPHGIYRLAPDRIEEFLTGETSRVICQRFGAEQAVDAGTSTEYSRPGACRTADGRLWFVTTAGLSVFDPHHLPAPAPPPRVQVLEILADGVHLARDEPVRVPAATRRIEIRYTAIALESGRHVRFRHRLDPQWSDWVDAGPNRAAGHSRPRPGDHTFQVTACNGDGIWSPQSAELTFRQLPLWHEQLGWRLAGVIALVGLLLTAQGVHVRWVRQTAVAQATERQRIARDLHDELGNRLSEIQLISERLDAVEAHATRSPLAGRLADRAAAAVSALDELVWLLNPRHDTWAALVRGLERATRDYLESAGVPHTFEASDPDAAAVPLGLRRASVMALRELLHNAVRHAQPGRIDVRVERRGGSIALTVCDDGVGFDAAAALARGRGLAGLRARAGEFDGRLDIHSQRGRTALTVTFAGGTARVGSQPAPPLRRDRPDSRRDSRT